MFNKIIIMGRLCADPEMKQTASGLAVTRIRVAVNRQKNKETGEQETDFFNVSCWRGTAELVCRYFSKGKMILIEGQMRNNDYTDSNGVKHYAMEILASSVAFCGDSSQNGNQSGNAAAPNYAAAGMPAGKSGYGQPMDALGTPYRPSPNPAAVPQYGTVPPPAGNPFAQAQPQPQAQRPAQPVQTNIGNLNEFVDILSEGELPF
jgi:single-strand DNA-binding protein